MKKVHFDIEKLYENGTCAFCIGKPYQKRIENIAFGLASAKDSCTIILGPRILTGKNYGTSDISSKRKTEGTESEKYSFHTRMFGNQKNRREKS